MSEQRWPTNEQLREWARDYEVQNCRFSLHLVQEIEHLRALCATAAEHVEGKLRQELKDAAEGR